MISVSMLSDSITGRYSSATLFKAGCRQLTLRRSRRRFRPGICSSICAMAPTSQPTATTMMPSAGRATRKGKTRGRGVSCGSQATDGASASVTSTMQPLNTTPAKAGSVKARSAKSVPLKTAKRLRNIRAGAVKRSSSMARRRVSASAPWATRGTIWGAKTSMSNTRIASSAKTRLINAETTRQSSRLPRSVMTSLSTGTMAPLMCPPISKS